DLEQFAVLRDGQPIQAADFNFWGVTFARDSNRFYATLGTGGHRYLVEGDIAARRVRVLTDGVECPSLSPDNARLAFKKRTSEGRDFLGSWRLTVLDLATLAETPLAEAGSVDDQPEWLDDGHVLYAQPGNPRSTWVVPADGRGPARPFLPDGFSPAVVR